MRRPDESEVRAAVAEMEAAYELWARDHPNATNLEKLEAIYRTSGDWLRKKARR